MARPRPPRTAALVGSLGALALAACGGLPSSAPTPALSTATPAPSRSVSPTASPASPSTTPRPGPTTPAAAPSPTGSATQVPSCAALVNRLSVSEQVGQVLMVAVSSTGLSAADAETVEDVRAGSVLLLGNSTSGVAGTKRVVQRVREAADPPTGVATLVAADQEGGLVQRLKGPGFSSIPSAAVQATWSDQRLADRAADWGRQLAKAGVDANLAPVADLVPATMAAVNQPIGRLHRGYGSSPKTVANKTAAFDRGMDDAGIATAAKHFPGLGRVRGNTDFATRVVDSETTRHDAGLAGFAALADARVDMVMVASATYTKIDARHRAVFSTAVISGLLRGDLGFTGVVISDDLSAAALRDVPAGERAVRFLQAGGDLAIVGDPGEARATAAAVRSRAEQDRRFARRLAGSATRVVAMKAHLGQARCSAS